jgi:hypothetical protein
MDNSLCDNNTNNFERIIELKELEIGKTYLFEYHKDNYINFDLMGIPEPVMLNKKYTMIYEGYNNKRHCFSNIQPYPKLEMSNFKFKNDDYEHDNFEIYHHEHKINKKK